jgi:hypothetical protein
LISAASSTSMVPSLPACRPNYQLFLVPKAKSGGSSELRPAPGPCMLILDGVGRVEEDAVRNRLNHERKNVT